MFGFGKSRTDVIALLKADHRAVEDLFAQFEKEASGPGRIELATRLCQELAIHARLEEELVYPRALATFAAEDQGLIWEATVEHGTLSGLIDALGGAAASDDDFGAHLKVLREYVKHHVHEEENEMFPRLRATGLDLEKMGEEITARKNELLAQLAPPERRAA